jgi:hypothetical protein
MTCSCCTTSCNPRASSGRRLLPIILGAAALAATVAGVALSRSVANAASAIQPDPHGGHTSKAAATYACPMKCEGTKTYDAPGKCPVCKMALKQVAGDGGAYSATVSRVHDAAKPSDEAIAAGEPVTLRLTLKEPSGDTVTKVDTVHEKPLHLLIVSKDLSFFAHEHPTPQQDGTFTVAFTFPAGGDYTLYHDFTPAGGRQQIARVPVKVEGKAAAPVALAVDAEKPKTIDGYTVSLSTGGPVKAGGSATLTFTLSKDGAPVTTLAPYLGAMGHLVVLSADGKEFVHSHPVGGHDMTEGGHAMTSGGPTVAFEAHFKTPGLYKGWGQFNIGTKEKERIITAPFTFEVAKGEKAVEDHGEKKGKDGGAGHGHDHK